MRLARILRPVRRRVRHVKRALACLAVFALLAACAPQPISTPITPTVTPTHTLEPSSTPVWFPPTETPTPAPILTTRPTQDFKPGLGRLIVEDSFSEETGWRSGEFTNGRITLGSSRLTLAISQPEGTLISLREGVLPADAYLEISASAALCRDKDQYGLLLRAASELNGYRLLASCAGWLRMERLRNGEIALMQDWTLSGELPKGGLLPVRFGIWSLGSELRVFVNGIYQFSVRDPVFADGQIGAFARSEGDTPLTVSFSDLKVYRLDPAGIPTATPRPSPTP